MARFLFLGLLGLQVVASSPVLHSRQYWPDPTQAPIPSEEKCIEESFSSPKWGIYDPALITVNGSSGGSQGDIRFLTMNTATGVVANCTAKNIELDPKGPNAADFWHNCSIPDLFFQFNLTSFDLRLKGTWSCGKSKYVAGPKEGKPHMNESCPLTHSPCTQTRIRSKRNLGTAPDPRVSRRLAGPARGGDPLHHGQLAGLGKPVKPHQDCTPAAPSPLYACRAPPALRRQIGRPRVAAGRGLVPAPLFSDQERDGKALPPLL